MTYSDFMARMLDPTHILTHIPYALLVISMMMNDMGWLRAIAIAAGIVRIINRAFFEIDPIIVFWEVIFVAVNVAQLLILWYYAKRHRFSEDEKRLVSNMPGDVDRRNIRRLLRLGKLRHADPDATLTTEGEPVGELMFLADGVVRIEKQGRLVAVCGAGDFIGEMSYVTRGPATATAVVAKRVRYFAFNQDVLRAAAASNADLQRALDASFSRDLAGKLGKSNAGGASG